MQNLLANDRLVQEWTVVPSHFIVPFLLVCLLLWIKRTFLTVGRVKRAGIRVWDPGRGSVHCLMWSVPEGLRHMEGITYPAGPERNHRACKYTTTLILSPRWCQGQTVCFMVSHNLRVSFRCVLLLCLCEFIWCELPCWNDPLRSGLVQTCLSRFSQPA